MINNKKISKKRKRKYVANISQNSIYYSRLKTMNKVSYMMIYNLICMLYIHFDLSSYFNFVCDLNIAQAGAIISFAIRSITLCCPQRRHWVPAQAVMQLLQLIMVSPN